MDRRTSADLRSPVASLRVVGALAALAAAAALALAGAVHLRLAAPPAPLSSPLPEACGGAPPPSAPVWVSDRQFKKTVLRAEVPVLVEFGAAWCLPCRRMVPTLEALAADYAGRAVIARVDIDADPYLAQDLGVVNLPTMMLFDDGRLLRRETGSRSRDELTRLLDQALAPAAGVVEARPAAAGAGV